jgi:putative transposase
MPVARKSTRKSDPDALYKAHRIALDPTDRQDTRFRQHCGFARVAGNWALDTFRESWFTEAESDSVWLSDMDLRKAFNAVKRTEYPWSVDLCQNVGKNAIRHMADGIQRWGKYRKSRKDGRQVRRVGFPKHRRKGRHMSFTFTNGRQTARVDGHHVHIPAVGWVRMREALRFTGDILSATVSLMSGRWFVSFQVQTADRKPALRPGPVVGIDMGIETLATLWDGEEVAEIANPRPLQAALKELRHVNKAIARSRKVHGPNKHSKGREGPVRRTATPLRQGVQHAPGPPSPGHNRHSQAGRHGAGGDPEHCRHGEEQPAGARRPRCGHGGVRADAGIQVRLVRDRLRPNRPVVSVLEDL